MASLRLVYLSRADQSSRSVGADTSPALGSPGSLRRFPEAARAPAARTAKLRRLRSIAANLNGTAQRSRLGSGRKLYWPSGSVAESYSH
jgi:hypothetical protein